jgi:hypothetical protein
LFENSEQFLYTHVWSKNNHPVKTAIEVMYAAKKYLVEDLIQLVTVQLQGSITLDTALDILKASILYDFSDLESKCWDCIELDTDRIVLTNEFLSLDRDIIRRILQKDALTISEYRLWDAVLRYECLKAFSI